MMHPSVTAPSQRDGVRNAAFGLTDEQARLTPITSTLSIGGLVKHLIAMERNWTDMIVQRERGLTMIIEGEAMIAALKVSRFQKRLQRFYRRFVILLRPFDEDGKPVAGASFRLLRNTACSC